MQHILKMPINASLFIFFLYLTLSCFFATGAFASKFKSPDILILGDSQITFGSGPAFLDFFQDLKKKCNPNRTQSKTLKKLGKGSVAVIGVRSSSLASWTAKRGQAKSAICDIDPKWKVNGGSYGSVNKTDNIYIQIGQGAQYQFCKNNISPFQAMFQKDYYAPKLFVMAFLGNSSKTWANNKSTALNDVIRTMKHLPDDLPCIFMTTAPAYKKHINDQRLRAQTNIKKAFQKSGSRCSFVEGLTAQSIAANLGNKKHFRLKKSGTIKDPYHPNKRAAANFFKIETKNICKAIFQSLAQKK